MDSEQEAVLSVHEAAALRENPEVLFLDVREDDEVAYCAIDGALHIPMGEVGERLQHLPKDRRIVVFCHHGMRSMHVTHFLRSKGFAQAQNMTGGIDAWSCEIDTDLRRY
jgi:rhodanese-related sulfurtransferase